MQENFEKYFTTSKFAKLYNLNKKTLIYYDEIDLFKPMIVKENGYRYYALQQCGIFEVILILKQLGMPLKSIKNYLKNRNAKELEKILQEQKANIESQIKNLNKINNVIKKKLDTLKICENIQFDTIQIENMKEEYFVLSKPVRNKDEMTVLKILYEHTAKIYKSDIYSRFDFGTMIKDTDIINGDCLNCSYFYIKLEKKPKNINCFVKPKGKYIVLYHKGHWLKFYKVYDKIKKYLENEKFSILGYVYEEYLLDEEASKIPDEYITKFMIQIS